MSAAPPAPPATPTRARFERRVKIRFGQCDPSGTVFYPQYFELLDGLVEDWFGAALGIAHADLLGPRRTGLPAVSLTAEFPAVSRMGDELTLGLELVRLGRSSITLALDAKCARTGEARVRLRKVLVTTSLDSHQAMAIPEDLRAAIERFIASRGHEPSVT